LAQFLFQPRDPLGMPAQRRAELGGPARPVAGDQHRPAALLERADALRDRRGRDMQAAGRGVEAAFAHHGRQRRELRIVDLHERRSCRLRFIRLAEDRSGGILPA
jgi:hypothetical protein